jgi:hypothetical protein
MELAPSPPVPKASPPLYSPRLLVPLSHNEDKGAQLRAENGLVSSNTSSLTVAVLASLHLDIAVHAPDRPIKGVTLSGSAWMYKAGGKGGNQAVCGSCGDRRSA